MWCTFTYNMYNTYLTYKRGFLRRIVVYLKDHSPYPDSSLFIVNLRIQLELICWATTPLVVITLLTSRLYLYTQPINEPTVVLAIRFHYIPVSICLPVYIYLPISICLPVCIYLPISICLPVCIYLPVSISLFVPTCLYYLNSIDQSNRL